MIFDRENNPEGLWIRQDINDAWGDTSTSPIYITTSRYPHSLGVGNYASMTKAIAKEYYDRTSIFTLRAWGRRGYGVEI